MILILEYSTKVTLFKAPETVDEFASMANVAMTSISDVLAQGTIDKASRDYLVQANSNLACLLLTLEKIHEI
jgi:hypothetical protein